MPDSQRTSDQRRLVQRHAADRKRLERVGIKAARAVGLAIRAAALRAFASGGDVAVAVQEASGSLTPVIADAMAAAHLHGRLRTVRTATAAVPEIRTGLASAYDGAVDFARQKLGLTDEAVETIRARYGAQALTVTGEVNRTLVTAANKALYEVTEEGLHVAGGMQRMREAFDRAGVTNVQPYLLENIVRTQIAVAYGAGRWNALQDPDIDQIIAGYTYVTVGDDRVRDSHAALDGTTLPKDDPLWRTIWPPNGYQSFLPGTQVAGEFISASKANYSGPVVEIQTADGSRLAVTINHPVLTPRGFVAAGDLREGDDLLQHLPTVDALVQRVGKDGVASPLVAGRTVDDQHAPAGIQQVFDAFAATTARATFASTGPLDFHGDAVFHKGKVHIVSADGMLPRHLDALASELRDEVALVEGYRAALLSRERRGEAVPTPTVPVRLGTPPKLDPLRLQPLVDDATRAAETLRQLEDGNAGAIRLNKIVSLNFRSWSGHVYDLQSPNGTIISNGFVVSNCRCDVLEVFVGEALDVKPPPEAVEIDGVLHVPGPDPGWDFNAGSLAPDDLAPAPV